MSLSALIEADVVEIDRILVKRAGEHREVQVGVVMLALAEEQTRIGPSSALAWLEKPGAAKAAARHSSVSSLIFMS